MKLNEIKQLDEANKHSFIGRIQRHQELKKKVDQTWKDAVDAEKRGDEKGANRAFKKHVRYANLERPGTWRDVKEQDVTKGSIMSSLLEDVAESNFFNPSNPISPLNPVSPVSPLSPMSPFWIGRAGAASTMVSPADMKILFNVLLAIVAPAAAVGAKAVADSFMEKARALARKKSRVDTRELADIQSQIKQIYRTLEKTKKPETKAKYEAMLKDAYAALEEIKGRVEMKSKGEVDEAATEGSGMNVVKSIKVGNFRHDLVDTGFGWQVRIYNGDELYDTGLSKNSKQKGLEALEDSVAYTEKQIRAKRQSVSEGDWGWDDPLYDHRPAGRDEDWEYELYRQSKLDDQMEKKKKPMGFQVYDGPNRRYIGKVFRSQADAIQFRDMQPGREHMSIQLVPLQESGSKNPHTSVLGRALYSALSKQKKVSPAQVERNK